MNETIKCIIERRSIRKYKQEQITDEELNLILLAGSYAPNAGGRQSPIMVVLQNKDIIARLGILNRQVFYEGRKFAPRMGAVSVDQPSIADDAKIASAFYGAPTVITVFVPKAHLYGIEDGSLVVGNMLLAAHSLGIGSCFIGRASAAFQTDEGKKIIKDWSVPNDYVAVGHCILGYPEGNIPKGKPRKEYVVKRIV